MPKPSTSTLPQAFKLVHQILSERPGQGLTTRELVREAIALYDVDSESAAATGSGSGSGSILDAILPSSSSTSTASGSSPRVREKKGKKIGVNVVPEGHPFISTSFLKHRVLPVLASQDLIAKSARPRSTESSSASSSASASASSSSSTPASPSSKPTFTWSLHAPRQSNLSSEPWSFPAHWDRLLAGTPPGQLHAEYTAHKAGRKVEEKERAFEGKKVRRSEREIWAWDGRAEGLTTRLERIGLNKRRQEARPKKERRRLQRWEELGAGTMEQGQGEQAGVVL